VTKVVLGFIIFLVLMAFIGSFFNNRGKVSGPSPSVSIG
jgi:hypothetical protein